MTARTADTAGRLRERYPGWDIFQSHGAEQWWYATPRRRPGRRGYAYTLDAETPDALGELIRAREARLRLAPDPDGPG